MLSSNLSASFFIALDYFLALIIAHFDEKCTVYREFYRLLVLKAVTILYKKQEKYRNMRFVSGHKKQATSYKAACDNAQFSKLVFTIR